MQLLDYSKKVPLRWKADVCIIGGGIAGICAACAAAASNVSVILVERFATTGGILTNGGVNSFCGETAGQGAVFDEIINELESFGAIAPYHPYDYNKGESRPFNHEILAVILQELLIKYNVKLLLHTRFADIAEVNNGWLGAILLHGQSGLEALKAKQYIDCSGEAQLAYSAGCQTIKGRESDGMQLPMSFMYFIKEVEEKASRREVPVGKVPTIKTADELPMTSIWPNGIASKAIKIKVPGFDSTDSESITQAEIQARRKMLQILDYHQRIDHKNWLFSHASSIIGIREGRRIVGNYILNEQDTRAGQSFDDGVAVGTFYLDAHDPNSEKRIDQIQQFPDRTVPPYHIPLRCLTARDASNLWMAGRNFSSDQLALSSARVATSSAMMGQAAGISAAIAAKSNMATQTVSAGIVQDELIKRNANLTLTGRPTSRS